jgi:hypothetical protein
VTGTTVTASPKPFIQQSQELTISVLHITEADAKAISGKLTTTGGQSTEGQGYASDI